MADQHPNVALIQRGYAAFANRDMATLRDVFAEDAVWHFPGRSPLAGDHRGVDAILQFLGKLMQLSGGTFKVEARDVLVSDRHAVALQHATGTRNDKTLDITACQLFTIRDGKVVEIRGYYSDQYALDDFWS